MVLLITIDFIVPCSTFHYFSASVKVFSCSIFDASSKTELSVAFDVVDQVLKV
jgi:hypothetical protein